PPAMEPYNTVIPSGARNPSFFSPSTKRDCSSAAADSVWREVKRGEICFPANCPSSCVTFFYRLCAIPMKKIKVNSANGAYEVMCGRGAVARSGEAVTALSPNAAVFLISSPRVWKHCGAHMEKIYQGVSRATILFDDR